MKVNLKELKGDWDAGWALDKHIVHSTFIGHDEHGHARFDTLRTEVGEATYQLKYKQDWAQVKPLAKAIADNIGPKVKIGFIVPMPASKARIHQPVTELAKEVGRLLGIPVFDNLLVKAANGKPLKDLVTKAEKVEAIGDSFSVVDQIEGAGPWNVLVIDDLFDTGASMEAACKVLRKYPKAAKVYAASLTWK